MHKQLGQSFFSFCVLSVQQLPYNTQDREKCRDVPVMPERGPKLLMALSSQRKQSFGETVGRKTMCRSGMVTRLVHICGLYFCHLLF